MWPVATDDADDGRDDHESKRYKGSDETVPMAREPSFGSGVKRSNIEAIQQKKHCNVHDCSRNDEHNAGGYGHDAGRSLSCLDRNA